MDNTLRFKVCETLLNLYCLYRQRWVCMQDPERTIYPTQTVNERYTDGTILNHLDGRYSVCVFAGKAATKFLTFDVDLGEPNVVHKVVDTVEELGIPRDFIYVSSSGRKGYHVEIFFRDYIYNNVAEKFYWAVIERSGLNPRKIEYRPTHTQAIKLPLGVHQVTGNRCWFVDRETLEPIENFEYIFCIERIPQAFMTELVNEIINEHMRGIYEKVARESRPVHTDISQESLTIQAHGTRHNLQKKVAARARLDGHEYDDIVQIQMEWYRAQNPALICSTESEVRNDAELLAAWAVKTITPREHALKPKNQESFIRVHKSSIPYILNAPTPATRKVLFLLVLFCDRYGEVQMSYERIAEFTEISDKSAAKAVKWLASNKFIRKERTFYKKDVFVTKCGANKYLFPGEKKYYSPERKNLQVDYYDIHDFVTADNFHEIYYRTLGAICKPEYLARFLTKPEWEACVNGDADNADGA